MSFDAEKLYELLPAIYRIRDIEVAGQLEGLLDQKEEAELQSLRSLSELTEKQADRLKELEDKSQSGPLKALLSVIAEQAAVLEEDLDQLYDDLFIETCAEWVVPYIGDLIGARGPAVFPNARFSERAFVANTLAYRRRKGTAAVLEQLARDVTGWDASVVEYFQLLATTQYMNHIRPDNSSVASLRRRHFAGLVKPQSADYIREADLRQWEKLEYLNTPFDTMERTADVRRIASGRGKYNIPNVGIFLWRLGSYSLTRSPAFKLDDRRYLFDALGKNTPLYNKVEPEDQITHLAEPINVPMPISRRVLDRDKDIHYGPDKSLSLKVNNTDEPPSEIIICNLSDTAGGWAHKPQNNIAIDPVLGRIAFPENRPPPSSVRVTYHYGFGAEMGGGEYERGSTFASGLKPVVKVPTDKATIQDALNEIAISGGVVEIENNEYFVETPTINVSAGKKIELRAKDKQRPVLVLAGDVLITGGDNSEVTLNGFLISGGSLRVTSGNKLRLLSLRHCGLVPGPSPAIKGVPAQPWAPRLFIGSSDTIVEVDQCISGSIRAVDGARVRIRNSVIDATDETAVAYSGLAGYEAGGTLKVEDSTIIGKVHTLMMELASNTIFLASLTQNDPWVAPVRAERLQQGCVRFSYVPPGSRLPRLHECQPKTADEAARVRPVFTSLRYGDAGYCQLSLLCAVEIRRGADDQAEMGAFHDLYQPQRESNLRAALDEYLRFGLEAGIFYAS